MSNKILYIEDDKDVGESVKIILEEQGYSVDGALTGKEGLDLAGENDYGLVLLDRKLPDISGWDVYQKLKNTRSKIVIISVLPLSEEFIREMKKKRILDYIVKPFSKDDFLNRIGKIVKK